MERSANKLACAAILFLVLLLMGAREKQPPKVVAGSPLSGKCDTGSLEYELHNLAATRAVEILPSSPSTELLTDGRIGGIPLSLLPHTRLRLSLPPSCFLEEIHLFVEEFKGEKHWNASVAVLNHAGEVVERRTLFSLSPSASWSDLALKEVGSIEVESNALLKLTEIEVYGVPDYSASSQAQNHQFQISEENKIDFVTTYYEVQRADRGREIKSSIMRNAKNPHVAAVHLLVEACLNSTLPSHRKIKITCTDSQPKYGELLTFASRLQSKRAVMLANGDIYITSGIPTAVGYLRLHPEAFLMLPRWTQPCGFGQQEPNKCFNSQVTFDAFIISSSAHLATRWQGWLNGGWESSRLDTRPAKASEDERELVILNESQAQREIKLKLLFPPNRGGAEHVAGRVLMDVLSATPANLCREVVLFHVHCSKYRPWKGMSHDFGFNARSDILKLPPVEIGH